MVLIFLVILSLLVVLLSGWRRDRRLLGEARSALQVRGAERTNELAKANEDLKRAQAELQRRWQVPGRGSETKTKSFGNLRVEG
jgi:C4-dicarboxylate-specific signal transduction histidine kinase